MIRISNINLTPDQLPASQQMKSPTTIYSSADFPVSHFLLLEKEGDLTTPEEHSSLISRGFSKKSIQDTSYWKTSKDCYLMTMDELSKPSSPRLLSWGMISNGKCLTQRISESPRIGKESLLSEILEETPDPKYFLSEETSGKILAQLGKTYHHVSTPTITKDFHQADSSPNKDFISLKKIQSRRPSGQ